MSNLRDAAAEFFSWFNRTYPAPSTHEDHPWCRLGLVLYSSPTNHPEIPECSVERLRERVKKDADAYREAREHLTNRIMELAAEVERLRKLTPNAELKGGPL